jgi:hypothetical protein
MLADLVTTAIKFIVHIIIPMKTEGHHYLLNTELSQRIEVELAMLFLVLLFAISFNPCISLNFSLSHLRLNP